MTALPPDEIDWRSVSPEIRLPESVPVRLNLDYAERQEPEGLFRFSVDKKVESSFETEIGAIRLLALAEAYDREIQFKAQDIYDIYAAYASRIEVLKEQAALDGYSLNPTSSDAFVEFLENNPRIRRGRLVLMENGNLRAVWKGENEAHIGLQFINNRSIQYVIFTRREPQFPVSRASGRDTLDGIERQIEAFDLNSVLYI